MARWLIVNSQKGKIAGRQIISPAVLADIQSPHMTTGTPQDRPEIGPAGYGLGWGIDDIAVIAGLFTVAESTDSRR